MTSKTIDFHPLDVENIELIKSKNYLRFFCNGIHYYYVGEIDNHKPKGQGTLFVNCYEEKQQSLACLSYISEDEDLSFFYQSKFVGKWQNFTLSGKGHFVDSEKQIYGSLMTAGDNEKRYLFNKDVKIEYANKDIFNGSITENFEMLSGTYCYNNGDKFYGSFPNEFTEIHRGVYVWKKGSVYTGDFKNNKRHGLGTVISKSGTMFHGRFQDDKAIRGTLEKRKRDCNKISKGDFIVENDIFFLHGDGSRSISYYKNKEKNTLEKGVFKKNVFIEGEKEQLANFKAEGDFYPSGLLKTGNIHFKKTNIEMNGTFYTNGSVKHGTYIHSNKDHYVGEFDKNGNAHGRGCYFDVNDQLFLGTFKNNKKEGIFEEWVREKNSDNFFQKKVHYENDKIQKIISSQKRKRNEFIQAKKKAKAECLSL